MDTPATDYLRHCLQQYEQSIDDTARHSDEFECFGRHPASAPYLERCICRSLLESPGPDAPGTAALRQEYLRITEKLGAFRRGQGRAYSDLLFSDLRQYLHAYHAATCFTHLSGMSPETARALSRRALIAELCRELDGDYDLSGIRDLLARLDEGLDRAGGEEPGTQAGLSPARAPGSNRAGNGDECGYTRKSAGRADSE
jgi:hypothetical protein